MSKQKKYSLNLNLKDMNKNFIVIGAILIVISIAITMIKKVFILAGIAFIAVGFFKLLKQEGKSKKKK